MKTFREIVHEQDLLSSFWVKQYEKNLLSPEILVHNIKVHTIEDDFENLSEKQNILLLYTLDFLNKEDKNE